MADELGLDLVEISAKADPPVCRILDYQKYLYQQRKKAKEMKQNASKIVIKEIRFGPNTDEHDFQFKLKHAQEFLSEGSKVKASIFFRGRSIMFAEQGEKQLLRFAVELGFDGYPSMQRSLQEMVRTRLTSVQRIEAANDRFGNQDVVSSVLQSDIDSIRLTAESLDRREMAACVEAILQAKHIYIVGVRSSAALAAYLNFYFRNLFDNVRLVSSTATSEMFEQMLRVGAGDVVLGISLPRYSGRTVKVMQYAHDRQATVLAITDKPDAPAGKFADHVLVAKSGMVSVVDSLVAAMSVINALVVSIGRSQERLLTQTFENLEHIWDEYDVYERVQ